MPMKQPSPCSHPGCGVKTTQRKCELHMAKEKAQVKLYDKKRGSSAKRGYCSPEWIYKKGQVKIRDMFKCQICGCFVAGKGQGHVDHIIPKSRGGTDDLDNLQLLCVKCHSKKTACEDGGYGR